MAAPEGCAAPRQGDYPILHILKKGDKNGY